MNFPVHHEIKVTSKCVQDTTCKMKGKEIKFLSLCGKLKCKFLICFEICVCISFDFARKHFCINYIFYVRLKGCVLNISSFIILFKQSYCSVFICFVWSVEFRIKIMNEKANRNFVNVELRLRKKSA
ncbi:hypothetical protein ACKWTF_006652 [Chironomus riparius]